MIAFGIVTHTHTHFIFRCVFQNKNLLPDFFYQVSEKQSFGKSGFGKTSFEKTGFYFGKEFLSKYSSNLFGVDL